MPWFYNDGVLTLQTYDTAYARATQITWNMDLRSTGTLNLGNDNFGSILLSKKTVLPGAPGAARIILSGAVNVNAFTYIDGSVTQFASNITSASVSYVRFGQSGNGALSSDTWTYITTAQNRYIPITLELAGNSYLTSTNSASYTFETLIVRAGAIESNIFTKNFTIYNTNDNNPFLGWCSKTITVYQSGTWDRLVTIGFSNVRSVPSPPRSLSLIVLSLS